VDIPDDVRLGQGQQVIVALEVAGPVLEPFATVVCFLQPVGLDHGAHGAIEDEDAVL
jgi:hypothetical protein